MSAFHSFIHRLFNVPLSKENFALEVNNIRTIAVNNGYTRDLVDNLIYKKQKLVARNLATASLASQIDEPPSTWGVINYIPGVSNKIRARLNKLGLKTTEVNKVGIGTLLSNNKGKSDRLSNSGIYQLSCNSCDVIYIGQSGRSIHTRMKEHMADIAHARTSTGFSTHCLETGHSMDSNRVELLHKADKGRMLTLLEGLEIKKALFNGKNLSNLQKELNNISSPLLFQSL